MKKEFVHRSTRTKANLRSPLLLSVVGVLLIVVSVFSFDYFSRGFLRAYSRGVGSAAWVAATGVTLDVSTLFTTKKALAQENTTLHAELDARGEEAARFLAIQEENKSLREVTNLVESMPGITARVVSTFRTSPYGTFFIAAGTQDGVSVGSVVITPGGFVLGRVSDVSEKNASVQSLFAPGIENEFRSTESAFAALGRGGGNASAEVPRDAQISVGDVVISTTLNGLPAGIIGSITAASSSATKTLYIRLPTNLDTLLFVYVAPK